MVNNGIQVLFLQSLGLVTLKPVSTHHDANNWLVHYIFHDRPHKVD